MKFFKLEKWRGQDPVRTEISADEAERLVEAIRGGHRWTQVKPSFDGETEVQVEETWDDLYISWLHLERGSWASWEGPQCSYGYFATYARKDAGHRRETTGNYRTIRHMPICV